MKLCKNLIKQIDPVAINLIFENHMDLIRAQLFDELGFYFEQRSRLNHFSIETVFHGERILTLTTYTRAEEARIYRQEARYADYYEHMLERRGWLYSFFSIPTSVFKISHMTRSVWYISRKAFYYN